jgi:ornithine cyclodeaminase
VISAARTAASAALAAVTLAERRGVTPRRIGFVGTGLIARYVHTYLAANGLPGDEVGVFDLAAEHARGFLGYLGRAGVERTVLHDSAESLLAASDLIVFATVASRPHVHDPALLAHNPIVLHVSLRDLSPQIVLSAYNLVDDVDHCLKADTSPHLAEQVTGNRDFVDGTLYDLLDGRTTPPADRPVVFSPFGLGVLDLAVAKHVYDEITAAGTLQTVPGFFHELKRHG